MFTFFDKDLFAVTVIVVTSPSGNPVWDRGRGEDVSRMTSCIRWYFDTFCCAGVYQSLTAGWCISRQDIDEAVNNVCEELAPIEIDVTNFILSSCRLTHQMLDISLLHQAMCDGVSRSASTVMSSCDDELSAEESATKSERLTHTHTYKHLNISGSSPNLASGS